MRVALWLAAGVGVAAIVLFALGSNPFWPRGASR